ncbi:MAG TPA: hypothetical protein PK781_07765 [Terrimesophilobacter sp.]|mgnify:CR=1 FL=1|nr:hypothetical protein [Terrimesophilobacter sp.]HRQ00344.1 hypothetical protein [Terrimesophilobacter sp.]
MNSLVIHLIVMAEEAEFDPNDVTPTWLGFLITFLVAVATVFLLWDMVRRIRRTRYRGEVREQLEAEHAAAEPSSDDAVSDDSKD